MKHRLHSFKPWLILPFASLATYSIYSEYIAQTRPTNHSIPPFKVYPVSTTQSTSNSKELITSTSNQSSTNNHLNFIADAAEKVINSVVSLQIRTDLPGFFEKKNKLVSHGSGFVISSDGSILTNAHVIADVGIGGTLQITTHTGDSIDGYVFSIDHLSDLAVVKPLGQLPSHIKPVVFGLQENLRPGDWVVAIGSPFGLANTVTSGVISCESRRNGALANGETRDSRLDFIQTDCVVHSGSSGGPLVNVYGKVIGINATRAEREGITFAIRVDNAIHLIRQLINSNQIRRPWFGIKMLSLSPDVLDKIAQGEMIKVSLKDKGIIISDVHPKSPAEAAGCLKGDIITAINGKPVRTTRDFHRIIAEKPVTESVKLSIRRYLPLDVDWDGRVGGFETVEKEISVQPMEIDISINKEIQSYFIS